MLAKFVADGIDLDVLSSELQDHGAESFLKSWNELVVVIASKWAALAKTG
jgi:transaldolase